MLNDYQFTFPTPEKPYEFSVNIRPSPQSLYFGAEYTFHFFIDANFYPF